MPPGRAVHSGIRIRCFSQDLNPVQLKYCLLNPEYLEIRQYKAITLLIGAFMTYTVGQALLAVMNIIKTDKIKKNF
jgi:hypothetical protein